MQYSQIEEANPVIQEDMDKIVSELGDNPNISIVLFGSYSKGEGGFKDGGPVNDYDFLLITEEEEDAVNTSKLMRSLGLKTKVDVQWVKPSIISSTICTQQWYEIAKAGKVIVGKLPKFPEWEAFDIPYSDALNSLERRATSMIIAKHEMLKGESTDWDKVMTQIGKMIIALGDATLIKRGSFSTSYRTRALLLGQDNISELYNTAVSYKLLGVPDLPRDVIWELWNITRKSYYNYITENKLRPQIGELMLAIDDTTSREELEQVIIKLGSGDWL